MLKNLIKTTLRNIRKNGFFSLLNIIGLAIGIAAAGLIFLWVEDELTFNHNFPKRNYLYQVNENQTYQKKRSTFIKTPGPLAKALKAETPGIHNTARLANARELFVYGDKNIFMEGGFADSSLFSMLSLEWLQGNASGVFNEMDAIVISETMASAFFGNEDPIGKILRITQDRSLKVTGVFRDFPDNCTFHTRWFAPFELAESKLGWLKAWGANGIFTYVELEPKTSVVSVDAQLKTFLGTKIKGNDTECFLFSMNDWNLYSHFTDGKPDGGRIRYVRLFSIISWIIIIIACINFMNLATASSERRLKEVGVRKVLGANRKGLILQFIGESLTLALISCLLAVGIIYLVMPSFNLLVEKRLSVNIWSGGHIGILVLVTFTTGLLSGSYPAFYLSSFNPIAVLKNIKLKMAGGASFTRKVLVVSQFSISIILIISTVIIYEQIQYVKGRDLGYNKDHLIYLGLQGSAGNRYFDVVRNDLIQSGVAENVSISLSQPMQVGNSFSNYSWAGKDPSVSILISAENASPQYIPTMHMDMAAGKNFDMDKNVDTSDIIINETLARLLGKEGKIGALIRRSKSEKSYYVRGIVKDFIYNDMYGSVAPLILFCDTTNAGFLSIRFKQDLPLRQALDKTENILKARYPGFPFEYKFVDKEFEQYFKTETLIGKLGGIFALLAILISCLGLLGLSAFTVEKRMKEIAVRKVLGATVSGLTRLLFNDFLQLVLFSCLIAFPVAWFTMSHWLEDYQYRVEIHWWVFILTGMIVLLISMITVSFQTIKAALTNPIKTLRSE